MKPSELNLRFDVLDKSKLEFLVNNNCFRHCPYAIKHYTLIARGYQSSDGLPTRVCLAQAAARGVESDRFLGHLSKYNAVLNEAGKPVKTFKFGQRLTLKRSWLKPEDVALMQRNGCVQFKLRGRDSAPGDYAETLRLMVLEHDA